MISELPWRRRVGPPRRLAAGGFSLIEITVAMAVGLILLNAAFALLTQTQKFVRRIEQTGARADLLTGQILWVTTGGTVASYPTGTFQGSLTAGYLKPTASSKVMSLAAATYLTPQLAGNQLSYGSQLYIPAVY